MEHVKWNPLCYIVRKELLPNQVYSRHFIIFSAAIWYYGTPFDLMKLQKDEWNSLVEHRTLLGKLLRYVMMDKKNNAFKNILICQAWW